MFEKKTEDESDLQIVVSWEVPHISIEVQGSFQVFKSDCNRCHRTRGYSTRAYTRITVNLLLVDWGWMQLMEGKNESPCRERERDLKRSDERGRNTARPADIESGMSHGKKEVDG